MLGAMIVLFLADLARTAIVSQMLSLRSSEFHLRRLERFELLERLELYFAKGGTRQSAQEPGRRTERIFEVFIMNVLITGGMGVNGAVTARLLVKEGLHPVLLDNRKDLSLMGDIKDKVDSVEADVCDQQALEKLVDDYKITHIAHLAA